MSITIELNDLEQKQLVQLLDIAIGGAPQGQRLQVADVALPIAFKIQTAQQAKANTPPSEVAN